MERSQTWQTTLYVVNEIVGTSRSDLNEAIKNGIERASRTLRNLDWFEVVAVRGSLRRARFSGFRSP